MEQEKFDKRKMLRYVGELSQLFGIKEYALAGGKAKGVKAFDIRNGSGLEFTVLADRCLDIAGLSFHTTNCSYLSKTGIVSPEYYNENGAGFLSNFFGGFLTTCGLRNVGSPCEDNGESFGLHGRISNTPAEEVCAAIGWEDGIPVMTVSGKMREARLFGENLVLHRKISCRYGENKILIQNKVENLGFRKEPLMLLFHFNLGYPLLDENAEMITATAELKPRDSVAEMGTGNYSVFQEPTPGYSEQVFYHNLKTDNQQNTIVALINKKIELGVALHFNKKQLFNFTQWKQMGEGEYVLGLEPCNCFVGGRSEARKNETLEYLEPGEIRDFDLTVEFFEGAREISSIIEKINKMQ